jgi:hypothetical protein
MNNVLKPCPFCGHSKTYKTITTEYVEIMCAGCGAPVKEYPQGRTRVYESIANCARYVMPKAIDAWNRMVSSDE